MAINRDKVEAQAIKLLQQGKLDKAIIELKKIVEHDPTDVRTLLKMGDTYVKLGAKKESIDAYEKAAGIYTEQGFFLKAVAVYKQILRVDASPPGLHLKLAELYQQLGLVNDALQHYQNVALNHEQNGRPKESLEILKRMVDLDPDNLASRIKLAELFAQQGHGSEAVGELRSALSFLKTQQRFDDYLRVGEKLVAYDASALDVAQELAQIYMQRGQANVALSKLQLCFKADPRNIDVLSMIAQAFLEMQQVPKTVSVYKEMAKIYAADERVDLAQQTWERVLELQPGDPDAEEALGHSPTMLRAPSVPTMVAPAMANAPMASAAVRPSVEDEQLARLLTETDVYVKYGLKDKAIEHLQKVFAVRADYIPALEKLARLVQGYGGSAYVDALRNLVEAAELAEHANLPQWRSELISAAAATSRVATEVRAASPPPARSAISEEGEVILVDEPSHSNLVLDEVMIEDPSGAVGFDDSAGLAAQASDEPILQDPSASLSLPPDEDVGMQQEVPRMPTGVLPAPARAAAARPPAPPRTDEISGDDADALVRQALQDISEADVEAAAELVLSDEEPALEDGGEFGDDDELAVTARAGTMPADDDIDRIAMQAVAEAHANVAAAAQDADVASTAMMEFSSAELEEIRDFEDPSGVTSPASAAKPSLSMPALRGAARLPDEFGDATVNHLPERSSDVPTDERPKRTGPAMVLAPPAAPALADASDDEDARTVAIDGMGALRTAPNPSTVPSAAPPASAPAVFAVAAPPGAFEGDVSDEFDPSSFDLPADVKEMLRRSEPAAAVPTAPAARAPPTIPAVAAPPPADDASVEPITSRDKLGLKAKAQGFENDPANQFFHDELEEAEFFIQQELLDEGKEILTAILDDVPDSTRVQWMLARIEAKEHGQAEPPAPWEQRILEEVQAQLDNLGLDDAHAVAEPDPETQQVSVDQVLSQFKQKVAEVIPAEDAATHYELGNAYRDMGLLDDACAEFAVAARNPGKAADARYLIGLTRMEQGRTDEAVEALEAALGTPGASRTQRGASAYQLGVCLEGAGRGAAARDAFKSAKADGHVAADLDRRIRALIDQHGDNDAGNGRGKPAVAVAGSRSKNIDYV